MVDLQNDLFLFCRDAKEIAYMEKKYHDMLCRPEIMGCRLVRH